MADLPLSREDRIMKDSKKQAQQVQRSAEWYEVLAVRNELLNIYNLVVKARTIVESAQQVGLQGEVVMKLIKDGTKPTIIFNFCESSDFEDWKELARNPRYIMMCRYMGFRWEEGHWYDEERGESKRILGIVLEFFELKYGHKGDKLIIETETFETRESKDFACVFSDVLKRVEEMYTVPYWKTIDGGRRKWASMID